MERLNNKLHKCPLFMIPTGANRSEQIAFVS